MLVNARNSNAAVHVSNFFHFKLSKLISETVSGMDGIVNR